MSGKKTPRKSTSGVLIAIISAITTIVVAYINRDPKEPPNINITATQAMFTQTEAFIMIPTETPDATATIVSPTDTLQPTPTLTATSSNTPTATLTHTFTPRPTNSFTATLPPNSDQMTASLVTNLSGGSSPAPVNISFDARNSVAQFANGGSEVCGNTSLCSFAFSIREGSQQVYSENNNSGRITYKFTNSGRYTVVVNVCRGNACDFTAITFEIK